MAVVQGVESTYPPPVDELDRPTWQARADAHAARVGRWTEPYLARRGAGVSHPVHDFLFTYYSQRPTALRRWHPGHGVVLLDAEELAGRPGYCVTSRPPLPGGEEPGCPGLAVSNALLLERLPLVESVHRLLVATAGRPASLGCLGLHEWAMVHRSPRPRHDHALRLGAEGTDRVVETHRVACTHFDAFRFFTDSARPLNTLQPGRDDRVAFEQPGCLHAGMDLYKHAFRLTPLVASELVADCFELAWEIRELDMRASPYDLSDLGFEPVRIETPQGKQEYVAAQRRFAERAAPLRARLVAVCEGLVEAARGKAGEDRPSRGHAAPTA